MVAVPTLPGLYYEQVPGRGEPSPLRSDVAGFVGRTRRGEQGRAIRVQGWREYVERFGGLDQNAPLTYCIRGYFENGGEVAWVVRTLFEDRRAASAHWIVASENVPNIDALPLLKTPTSDPGDQPKAVECTIEASSNGAWADGSGVQIEYQYGRSSRALTLAFTVRADGEPVERLRVQLDSSSDPDQLEREVTSRSKLIRVRMDSGAIADLIPPERATTPTRFKWNILLKNPCGTAQIDNNPCRAARNDNARLVEYRAGLSLLYDQPEVALIALPGAWSDLSHSGVRGLYEDAITRAAELQDRLVLVDVPQSSAHEVDAIAFADGLRSQLTSADVRRAAAVYHPWLRVNDSLGGNIAPLRAVPPSGHVAGVISREDRDRGAHHTPANVRLDDAVDIESTFDAAAAGRLSAANVNLIRCVPGRGLTVWGGRTLSFARDGRFIGHRRFMHRLVRSIRRVAEPLVFETNGPEQWLSIVRAVTSVLLEAFRTNAFQGARPEDAFRVRCNEQTNPRNDREQGRMLCEIDLALAAPMEFITLRVAVNRTGRVEVFDA